MKKRKKKKRKKKKKKRKKKRRRGGDTDVVFASDFFFLSRECPIPKWPPPPSLQSAWFDTHLTFERHISDVCNKKLNKKFILSFIQYYTYSKTFDSGNMLKRSSMHLSQVDYIIVTVYFFGLPDSQLGKLQRVQSACARLVCKSPRFSHCTPLLSELHWLPIKQRIIFKTLLITYKAIHGKAPVYIQELWEMNHHLKHTTASEVLKIKHCWNTLQEIQKLPLVIGHSCMLLPNCGIISLFL